MYEDNIGINTSPKPSQEKFRFTYNWPYDYFSLVETGKLEVGLEFHSGSIGAIPTTDEVDPVLFETELLAPPEE